MRDKQLEVFSIAPSFLASSSGFAALKTFGVLNADTVSTASNY